MKATLANGTLVDLVDCYIKIPELNTTITMNALPSISDSKGASYTDEVGMGRSMPFKNYQSSENRSISWVAHFMVCQDGDQQKILNYLRAFEACTYAMTSSAGGAPYSPPPVCKIRCGELLSDFEVCCVLKNYSVSFDENVPWDEETFIPYKMDISLQFDTVYNQADLPGAERIMTDGY